VRFAAVRLCCRGSACGPDRAKLSAIVPAFEPGLSEKSDPMNGAGRALPRLAALFATVLAATGVRAIEPAPAPAALSARLASLSGIDGRDCGAFPLRSDLAAAVVCAKDATASGKPYRLAVQLQGIDSAIWQGAARDAQGRLWVVFYDADSSGGGAASPTISVVPCRDIVFALHGGEVLDCQPYSGEPGADGAGKR